MAIGGSLSVGLIGLKAFIIQIQAFISPGLLYFSVIGLPDASLSEPRERVKSACQASGFKWPDTRVTVNMSPASMPKRGASHDLAIAAGVLSAAGAIPARQPGGDDRSGGGEPRRHRAADPWSAADHAACQGAGGYGD